MKENSSLTDETNSTVLNTDESAALNPETENFQSVNIKLPEPKLTGNTPLEETILKRRSVRDFLKKPLSLEDVSQLLWSAQGITDKQKGRRTAPSAGALYPLEIYIAAGNISGLEQGIYKYKPTANELIKIAEGDYRKDLSKYSAQPKAIQTAPLTIVFSAVYERTSVKYGSRAERYVHIETGHASQNVCLQVISLGLSTVTIGAFQDEQVKKTMQMQENEEPLYIMPVGYGK
jgi:SagB-type dehydrogenase family enzyme